jgi:hypothetical protein
LHISRPTQIATASLAHRHSSEYFQHHRKRSTRVSFHPQPPLTRARRRHGLSRPGVSSEIRCFAFAEPRSVRLIRRDVSKRIGTNGCIGRSSVNHRGFFDVVFGVVLIYLALSSTSFEPIGITTRWFFKNRRVRGWPFRIFYCALGILLIYVGFRKRFGG